MTLNQGLPGGLSFNCYAIEDNFHRFSEAFLDIFDAQGLPGIARWSTHAAEGGSSAELRSAIDDFPRSAKVKGKQPYAEFGAGAVSGMVKFFPQQNGQPLCRGALQVTTAIARTRANLLGFQRDCVSICAALLGRFHVYSADLCPDSEGLCLPVVPLVEGNSHIVVTNDKEVSDLYDDPTSFWNAGWGKVAERAGQVLLAREMDSIGGAEYLGRLISPQWALARAAKSGETDYPEPLVLPAEAPVFNAGDARLQSVGYDDANQLLEYSCVLDRGQHVQGWEVFALRKIVLDGKSAEGWPVKTVRIVFMEQWMAAQEKRPLLDIGCKVFYYGDDGELKEFED